MEKTAVIVGGGIGGLGAAALLAREGYRVIVLEKNGTLGGVCNRFTTPEGFVFDTGPSWYMMPEIYDYFFGLLGENIHDHLDLVRLGPSYRVFFENKQSVDLYSDFDKDFRVIEQMEMGAGEKARNYFQMGKEKYAAARKFFLHTNFDSLLDFVNWPILKKVPSLGLFSTMDDEISKRFKSEDLQKIFHLTPSFLGGAPWMTPALFSFMNYLDFGHGVWYPRGGMYEIVSALVRIGKKNGVQYRVNAPVKKIETEQGLARGVILDSGERIVADVVISNADVGFTETHLLEKKRPSFYRREME